MPKIKDPWLVLEWKGDETSVERCEPSDFLYQTVGKIYAINNYPSKTLVGKFRLYYVDATAAINEDESVFDVFDTTSDTAPYYDVIFEKGTTAFNAGLVDLLHGEIYSQNVLILDRLEILPRFRNQMLGLLIMRQMIRRFSAGADLVAIKPFPLQFEDLAHEEDAWREKLKLEDLEKDNRKAVGKLIKYYGRLGFVALKGSPFMFRSTATLLPTREALKFPS